MLQVSLAITLIVVGAAATMQTGNGFRDARDGVVYPVVRVGALEWLGRNLMFASKPSWCYGDQPLDCTVHGRLYQWEAALGACPTGWRLPTDEDWMTLEFALGMAAADVRADRARGTDQGLQLQRGRGSLDVVMSGYRRPDGGYGRRGERAAFWSATAANGEDAWHRDVRPGVGTIYRSPVTITYALSVRCVRQIEKEKGGSRVGTRP